MNSAEPTVRDLFARVIDDVANVVRAEFNLYRQTAFRRAARARSGVTAVVCGVVIVTSGLVTLLVGILLALAPLVGPILAGIVIAAAAAIAGYLLIRAGAAQVAEIAAEADQKDHESVAERVL